MRADSIRQTASTAPRASVVTGINSELPGLFAPSAFPLDPLVVLRELVDRRHPPNFGLAAGRQRRALCPLDGFLLRRDIENVVAAEQFLGLAVRPVGDNRCLAGKVDDDTFVRIVQTLGRKEDTGTDQLVVELAHALQDLVE